MKIIENNSHKSDFPRRVTCEFARDKDGYYYDEHNSYCGSILEIVAADIKKHHWRKYDEGGTSYVVVCPVCGCWIEIDANTLNSNIKANAEEIQRGRR